MVWKALVKLVVKEVIFLCSLLLIRTFRNFSSLSSIFKMCLLFIFIWNFYINIVIAYNLLYIYIYISYNIYYILYIIYTLFTLYIETGIVLSSSLMSSLYLFATSFSLPISWNIIVKYCWKSLSISIFFHIFLFFFFFHIFQY